MSLKNYRQKRTFDNTPEPKGQKGKSKKKPMFVIQKHNASSMHYDFRLEVEGVLKSWAVPKGPSLDPSDKRLAMPTEDHPMDYGDFEGMIPEGNYGAGSVILWDTGTYENLTKKDDAIVSMSDGLTSGLVVVRLHGKKLKGGFALKRIESGSDTRWLLIKKDDTYADARRNPVSTQPESVVSGKTNRDLENDEK